VRGDRFLFTCVRILKIDFFVNGLTGKHVSSNALSRKDSLPSGIDLEISHVKDLSLGPP